MEAARRNRSRWQYSPLVLVSILAMLAVVVLMPFGRTAKAADPLISQAKPTTASSIENAGTPAANATDGNAGTRWSSAFADPQWLQVDLGATATISQVTLNWEAAHAATFTIQTSATGTGGWTDITPVTAGVTGVQTLTVTGSGRYIRMNGLTRATGYGYSLWEFQVYGTFGTGGGGGCNTTTNAALGKTAVASSVENAGNPASAAVDGSTTTRWSSVFSDPQWIYVDLGSSQSICQVVLNWEAAYGKSFQIQTSPDAGTWTTIFSTTTGTGGVQTIPVTGTGRYVRMNGTVRGSAYGYSLWEFGIYLGTGTTTTTPPPPPGCTGQSDTPSFGPNVHIFDPSMSAATIQAQLNTDFNAQKDTNTAQFSNNRVAELYKPGTYAVSDNVGFYTTVAGLGLNPDDVTINGDVTVDAFNASDQGNATQNFWREADNLSINPSSGSDRWAVAQAAPFRRIDVHGGLQLAPASNGYASGGYISDTKVSGQVSSVSQQQWYSQDSNFGSWAGGVWNMVFAGVTGAPAASFPSPPETVLATTPVARDIPYLYVTTDGKYHVFVPSLRTNASGTSWPNTAGSSVAMSQFYVAQSGDSSATIQAKLDAGCNLFFTPGVYHLASTLNVNNANTVVLGIGYPTLIPDGGVDAMHVANVDGVRIKGLLFSAGTTNSASLLTIGVSGQTGSHASNPISVQDTFFRIGGDAAGKATQSLVVNASNTLIDHVWAWRADHGTGVGWTSNTADTGLTVNGNNVQATGLFVEHYQKYEVVWNGTGGSIIFFQNENPYDPPNQAAWMNGSLNGYAAIKVNNSATGFQGWGWGSYCYFNVNPAVNNYHAFEVPTSGVSLHNLVTVSLGNVGTITHVVNDTGAQTPTNTTPSAVISYP